MCRGDIVCPPTWRSIAFFKAVSLQGKRTGASNARPYESFSTVCAEGSHMGTLGVLHFMLFDCPVNSITRLTAMHRSQPLFQHIVQLLIKLVKKPGTKVIHLRKLGIPADKAYQWANSRLGYWRIAGSPDLKCSITNERLAAAGYFSILNYYESLHSCG